MNSTGDRPSVPGKALLEKFFKQSSTRNGKYAWNTFKQSFDRNEKTVTCAVNGEELSNHFHEKNELVKLQWEFSSFNKQSFKIFDPYLKKLLLPSNQIFLKIIWVTVKTTRVLIHRHVFWTLHHSWTSADNSRN